MSGMTPVVEAVAALFRDKIAEGCEGAAALETVLAALASARSVEMPAPQSLPAVHYWAEALRLATERAPAPLVAALRDAAPDFRWQQNPNYLAKLDADYLSGYGFVGFAGPDTGLAAEGIRIGLLLIGPERHYPEHNHPAEEIYLPLTDALWWREGEEWREVAPMQVIHHAPWRVHATKTRTEPLLALYAWLGEVERNADLTES